MAEKSEHETSKSGQDVETPETEAHKSKDAEKGAVRTDPQGEPKGDSDGGVAREGDERGGDDQSEPVDAAGNAYPTNPEQPKPYSESDDFVPDPTAMSGTLETSGTGGGVHDTIRGTSDVFTDLPPVIESHGLPLYRSDVVSGDGTGQPEPHGGADANVATTKDKATDEQREEAKNRPASDADGVSAGTVGVAQPEATSYSENVIAGAADPNQRQSGDSEGAATTARKTGETPESESKEGEEKESEDKDSAKKTTARKTTARKTTASKSATDK